LLPQGTAVLLRYLAKRFSATLSERFTTAARARQCNNYYPVLYNKVTHDAVHPYNGDTARPLFLGGLTGFHRHMGGRPDQGDIQMTTWYSSLRASSITV